MATSPCVAILLSPRSRNERRSCNEGRADRSAWGYCVAVLVRQSRFHTLPAGFGPVPSVSCCIAKRSHRCWTGPRIPSTSDSVPQSLDLCEDRPHPSRAGRR